MTAKSPYGCLYLLPTPLCTGEVAAQFSPGILALLGNTKHFIVEELRTARRLLRRLDKDIPIDELDFSVYNEHSRTLSVEDFLTPLMQGHDTILMSEAGHPCIGDPGHGIVMAAQQLGIRVIPLPGPSSLLMALMASGLNGERFSYCGYLPVVVSERTKKIREMVREMQHDGHTRIIIETPYRNMALLKDLCDIAPEYFMLCIAADISCETEFIVTKKISEWKKQPPALHKRPAVFVLGILKEEGVR